MICGPKNVGKSSFAKFLSNSFISRKFAETGLAYLDLDPGQPEYTAPADLSLSHVKTFNFGPNFSHPSLIGTQRSKTLRQHHYGHMSPRDDWNHYLDCASDLYHHYESTLKSAGCPIIINTCGWVQGSGLDLLDTLTVRLKPSRIVCFTSSETDEMISLQKQHRKEVLFINSRAFPPNSTSAADLRSMQHCSFFHLEEPENRNLHWHANPILKSQTIDLAYASTRKIISAILLLGDRINYDMLDDAIDRTVMALVAIEDSSAVSNALLAIEDESLDDAYMDIHTEPEEDIVFESEEDALVVSQQYILRKNSRGLPFLCTNSGNNPPLDPSKTRSLGQVLLNSIDHDQQILRIHTPISQSDIKVCVDQGLSLILVRGRLGTPEWSYLEEYVHAKTIQEDIVDLQGLDQADAANDDFDFDVVAWAKRTPYVEYQSTQGKRNRSKVRRIRRNLGGKPSS